MRQVMPHRNNIVVTPLLQEFSSPDRHRPLKFGDCGNLAPPGRPHWVTLKLTITMIYNDLARASRPLSCHISR